MLVVCERYIPPQKRASFKSCRKSFAEAEPALPVVRRLPWMAGYTMVSAGRCVALGYGTLALFVAYIVFDIWRARSTDALAWNVMGTRSSTEENAAGPTAENSEDAQLPSPAQVQLERAAALAEEEPAEPLLFALRCLVCFGLVTTTSSYDVVLRFNLCEHLIHLAAASALCFALLCCDHLDHRSMVETAVLPMMAWSVHRQIVDVCLSLEPDMRGLAKDKWRLCLIQSTVLFSAVLHCLGFLWLAPGSAERHALELIAAVMYSLPSGGLLVLCAWWVGSLHSVRLLGLLPLFVSPLVHLYVSPPSAWDLAEALLWTPSWGLFLVLSIMLCHMYSTVEKMSQAIGAVGGEVIPTSEDHDETLPSWALHVPGVQRVEARIAAASTLPFAAAGVIVCVWLPLCLVTSQPGCVLYGLLALSVVPPMILFFLAVWIRSTAYAPPPCNHVLMPAMASQFKRSELALQLDVSLVFCLPFLLFLVYAHPVTRVPLAFLLPMAGWCGDSLSFKTRSVSREELELEHVKCAGLEERLSNLQNAERRLQDQADAHPTELEGWRQLSEELYLQLEGWRQLGDALQVQLNEAVEAAAREKRRFAELKHEAEVARGVTKAAVEETAVLRKHGDEMERRRDEVAAQLARLSTDDAARRRELLALQASVDELGARVEHHRTAAGTLRTRNTELKAQLKEQRRLADSAVATAAAMQEAESQGDAALAAELAAIPPPASQHSSSSRGRLECSICLHDLRGASAQERLALPCAHVFHAACVEPWLRTHSECPECKTPVR